MAKDKAKKGEGVWMDPPRGKVEKMMLKLAKAHDKHHIDHGRHYGAENAVRAANGLACPYWERLARVALGKKKKK